MWIKAQSGMTLVELIIAMVIIGVGVAGIIGTYETTTKNSASPVLQKQVVAIAEGMMEEIQRMPFAAGGAPPPAVLPGCPASRSAFDDVRDYHGYDCNDARDILGNLQLSGYRVQVSIAAGASPGFPGVSAADLLTITVTVTSGGATTTLVGWRTNYARLIP